MRISGDRTLIPGTSIAALPALLSQGSRLLAFELPADHPLSGSEILVERVRGREAVSETYHFDVDLLSADAQWQAASLLGAECTLKLARVDGTPRLLHGYVSRALPLGTDGDLARYRLRLEGWLTFLRHRHNCLVFQDLDVREILTQLFADYTQANFVFDITTPLRKREICTQFQESDLAFMQRLLAEEGLCYFFEHEQQSEAQGTTSRHRLHIVDTQATPPACAPPTLRFHRIAATETEDSVTALSEQRALTTQAVSVASWDHRTLQATSAQSASGFLEYFDASRAARYPDPDAAQHSADRLLQALQVTGHRFEGASSGRGMSAGATLTVTDGPYDWGALRILAIEHDVANNLPVRGNHPGASRLLETETARYRNRFLAVPAATPLIPVFIAKPTARGMQTARIIGLADSKLTSNRDHQVRIQFHWQRGRAPNPGGLSDAASRGTPKGHAPGNETTGTWVRVAEALAGPNFGSHFTPRVGSEVLIDFLDGDIDQPLIVGRLYNGEHSPPFSAGTNGRGNHSGVLSGMVSQALDGADTHHWVTDDATGQLRTSLATTQAQSALSLGRLIDHPAGSPSRGNALGEGFELRSAAWAQVRAPQGLLISATAREGGKSTQLDARESLGQLGAGMERAQSLSQAAQQGAAAPLQSLEPAEALLAKLDPNQEGKYAGPVNGHPITQPVEKFATPAMLVETPANQAWATPASVLSFASRSTLLTTIDDAHFAAGHTIAGVAGKATSLYSPAGGVKLIAGAGPVSLQAHTNALGLLANKDLTVTSSSDSIHIQAKTKITFHAGDSAIVLDGANITLSTSGTFSAKSSTQPFVGPKGVTAILPALPTGIVPISAPVAPLQQTYSQEADFDLDEESDEATASEKIVSGLPVSHSTPGVPVKELLPGSILSGEYAKQNDVMLTKQQRTERALMLLKSREDLLRSAGENYGIDPRSIAAAIAWEFTENRRGYMSDVLLPASWQDGYGWGSIHDTTLRKEIVEGASEDRSLALRSNLDSAIDLVGARIRQQVDTYQSISGIDLSNNPAASTWLFNTSSSFARDSAKRQLANISDGLPPTLDITNDMAHWTSQNLDTFIWLSPENALANQGVSYGYTVKAEHP